MYIFTENKKFSKFLLVDLKIPENAILILSKLLRKYDERGVVTKGNIRDTQHYLSIFKGMWCRDRKDATNAGASFNQLLQTDRHLLTFIL